MDGLKEIKLAPERSFPAGFLSEEEANEVRAHHEERVEEWLDECCFLTELFELHAKYGIDTDEEGYVAYRRHLWLNYNTKIAVLGPRADPVGEGCDCIFCKSHPLDPPVEEPAEKQNDSNDGAREQVGRTKERSDDFPAEEYRSASPCRNFAALGLAYIARKISTGSLLTRGPPIAYSPAAPLRQDRCRGNIFCHSRGIFCGPDLTCPAAGDSRCRFPKNKFSNCIAK